MLEKILAIIVFIIAFAALVCIHEAGHLSMAKLFKVYCKEYSIGFGPAIYSKKRKGHETKFSVRCVPLGGYVSMYGETEEEDEDFKDIPKERSLEGVKKWKKAIIVSAGVILNAILAFVLIFVSNFAFPVVTPTRGVKVEATSQFAMQGVSDNDEIRFIMPEEYVREEYILPLPFEYEYTDSSKIIHAGNFYIVDSDIKLEDETQVVLTFMYSGNKNEPKFNEGLTLYKAATKEDVKNKSELNKLFYEWSQTENSPEFYPDFELGEYLLDHDEIIKADVLFKNQNTQEILGISAELPVKFSKKGNTKVNRFDDVGLSFYRTKVKLGFKQRMNNTFEDYGNASIAVFKGLKVLFTGGIKNMSGVLGILDTSTSIFTNYTMATYLYFWGLISVNLAIFNLLPFPGLDGWQLLVTAIEGITRKKLPAKFKTIMSAIGLVILFGLMIVILGIDFMRITGI